MLEIPFEYHPVEAGGDTLMLGLVDVTLCLALMDWGRCITLTGSLSFIDGMLALDSLVAITDRVVGDAATCKDDKEYEMDGVGLKFDHFFSTGAATCVLPQSGLDCSLLKDCKFLLVDSTSPFVTVLR